MKIVLQRVARASVTVDGKVAGRIDKGLLILLGVQQNDTQEQAQVLALKCAEMRIFPDEAGKMNLSAKEIGGAALVISQFTLYGDCKKGRRPNFMEAAGGEKAKELYECFVSEMLKHLNPVQTGIFGASMQVELVNDGPVTLILERGEKGKGETEKAEED